MSRSRLPLILGTTAVGGIGYYFYTAGGNASVAKKQAQADAHKLSAKVKSETPGRGSQAESEAKKYGAEAGAKFDSAVDKSQAELRRAEAYAKDTKEAALQKVSEFDKKVETEASKAKSGISSWFGSSK